jgi:hypothetical protein
LAQGGWASEVFKFFFVFFRASRRRSAAPLPMCIVQYLYLNRYKRKTMSASSTPSKQRLGVLQSLSESASLSSPPPSSPNSQGPALWMDPQSGRHRIGPSGIPLKFSLTKLAQAKALNEKHGSTGDAGAGGGGGGVGGGAAKQLPAEEGPALPSSAPAAEGGGDKIFSHHLQLLSSLIDPQALAALELGCVQAPTLFSRLSTLSLPSLLPA